MENAQVNTKLIFQLPIYYSDLKNDIIPTESTLSEFVSSFKKEPTFFLLTLLNMFLSFYDHEKDKALEIQKWFLDSMFDDELFALINQKFQGQPMLEHPTFHRQQLLYLMKVVLREANGENNPNEETVARHKLGKVALIVNNILFPKEQEEKLVNKGGQGEDERLHDELFAQWLFQAELLNPPEEFHSIPRIHEYIDIFGRGSDKYVFANGDSLTKRFERITGLTPKQYLFMMDLIYAYYSHESSSFEALKGNLKNLNFFKDKIFANTDVMVAEANAFWDRTVKHISELTQLLQTSQDTGVLPRYDFRVFRTYPLVYTRDERDIVTCIDYSFLKEKLASSIYHIMLTMPDKSDTDRFMENWGYVFEDYLNDRLREIYPPGTNQLYCSPRFDSTQEPTFDNVIDFGDSIVIIEAKSGYLKLGAKYSEDAQSLLADIDKKIGRQKGIRQLANDLEKVFHSDSAKRQTFSEPSVTGRRPLQFTLEDIGRVKKVYPVILVQDFSLEVGFANRKLRKQFAEAISERKVVPSLIRPLSLLTIEDLEKLIPYLGPITFPDILDDYTSENHEPIFTFQNALVEYVKKNRIPHRLNEWVNNRFKEILKEMKIHFISGDGVE
jgi:hypothetical protein